jgi:DMSO/TMAO reductase YedYZ heme-binding membrane subunit
MTRWKLFSALSAFVALMTAAAYALEPDTLQSLQSAVRFTARASFLLFLATFTASSLATLAPSALTRALLRERRYLGLSFAFAHFLHAAVLTVYYNVAPEAFWVGRTPLTNVPGTIGYVAILLLTITSFKTPTHLIGPQNWKILHRTGVWIIAVVFAGSFLTRISHHAGYVVPGLIMIAAMLLRIGVWFRKASAGRPVSGA